MGNGQDRQMVQSACKRRWPIPRDVRRECLDALAKLLKQTGLTVRETNSIVRTYAQLDRLNTEWDKIERLDAGRPTNIELVIVPDSPGADQIAEALREAEEGDLLDGEIQRHRGID